MGRYRKHVDAAERQRSYRERVKTRAARLAAENAALRSALAKAEKRPRRRNPGNGSSMKGTGARIKGA
jgi:hypothetical protein